MPETREPHEPPHHTSLMDGAPPRSD